MDVIDNSHAVRFAIVACEVAVNEATTSLQLHVIGSTRNRLVEAASARLPSELRSFHLTWVERLRLGQIQRALSLLCVPFVA